MLQPPPGVGSQNAEDRLGPEHAAQPVVRGDDGGGREEHPDIPVEGQEREGPEDVEVRLDATAGQVDQERGEQHLGHRDHMAGQGVSRSLAREQDREDRQDGAQVQRAPDVQMDVGLQADPGLGRDREREDDAGHPLHDHQDHEDPVRPHVDRAEVALVDLGGAAPERRVAGRHHSPRVPQSHGGTDGVSSPKRGHP